MSDRIDELEFENRQLRSQYQILEQQYEELEVELEAARERITELEGDLDASDQSNDLGSDEERLYVASRNRRKFHRPSCEFAAYIIHSPNLIEFGSHREAREAGYKPCGRCRA
jgi:septal ring factor EnvC (AmiA/AmiB activator)